MISSAVCKASPCCNTAVCPNSQQRQQVLRWPCTYAGMCTCNTLLVCICLASIQSPEVLQGNSPCSSHKVQIRIWAPIHVLCAERACGTLWIPTLAITYWEPWANHRVLARQLSSNISLAYMHKLSLQTINLWVQRYKAHM